MNKRANKNASQWINTIRRYLGRLELIKSITLFQPRCKSFNDPRVDTKIGVFYSPFSLFTKREEIFGLGEIARDMENSFSIKLEASMANFDVLPPIFTTFFIQVFIVASIRRDPTFFSRFRIGGRMIFPRWYFSIAFSKDIIVKFFWMAMKISYRLDI